MSLHSTIVYVPSVNGGMHRDARSRSFWFAGAPMGTSCITASHHIIEATGATSILSRCGVGSGTSHERQHSRATLLHLVCTRLRYCLAGCDQDKATRST